jgi:hypothetical protein
MVFPETSVISVVLPESWSFGMILSSIGGVERVDWTFRNGESNSGRRAIDDVMPVFLVGE